jgi:hypothetical protein
VKGNRVADGELLEESEALHPAANNFHALFTEQQLASDEFEFATRDGDEVTAQ